MGTGGKTVTRQTPGKKTRPADDIAAEEYRREKGRCQRIRQRKTGLKTEKDFHEGQNP